MDTHNELHNLQIKKSIKAEVISIAKIKIISQSQGKYTGQKLKAFNLQALQKLILKKALDPTVYELRAVKKLCKQQHSALQIFRIFKTTK